jgi:hypothetical protein
MLRLPLQTPVQAQYVEEAEALYVTRFPATGQLALLTSDEHRLSVALPGVPLAADELLIKSYSENAGVAEALVAAGVIRLTDRVVPSGYVELPVAQLIHPAFTPNAL